MGYEYPRWKYHLTKDAVVVNNPNEEAALGPGWSCRPLDRYPETRPARNDPQACLKWVDEWSVPNLSAKHRKRIKVHLLKVEAVFCKSPDFSTGKDCMRRAFAGVAEVLFQAGMLSERLLENEFTGIRDGRGSRGWLVALCFRDGPRHLLPEDRTLFGVVARKRRLGRAVSG